MGFVMCSHFFAKSIWLLFFSQIHVLAEEMTTFDTQVGLHRSLTRDSAQCNALEQQVEKLQRAIGQCHQQRSDMRREGNAFPFPPLPNVAGRFRTTWVNPPPLFPEFQELTAEEFVNRSEYWISFGALMIALFIVLGSLLMVLRNKRARSSAGYQVLVPEPDFQRKRFEDWWKHESRSGRLVGNLMFVYISFIGVLLWACLACGTVSSRFGVGFEFWISWLLMTLTMCMIEAFCLFGLKGHRSVFGFSKNAIFAICPVFSERVDTAKDFVFAAITIHEGDIVLGALNVVMLIVAHANFLLRQDVLADLTSTYLPLLSSAPSAIAAGGSTCESEIIVKLLQQASPGRRFVAMCEDFPQCIFSLIFLLRHGHSIFVYVQIGISVMRLSVCRMIRPCLNKTLSARLSRALVAGHKTKALALMRKLLEVDPDKSLDGLKRVGYNASQLKQEGFSLQQMSSSQSRTDELNGYTVEDLREAGFKADEMKRVGKSVRELKQGGYTAMELKKAGYSVSDMKQGGFTVADLKLSCAAHELKEVGYSTEDLKDGGFTISELAAAGFSVVALKDVFTLNDFNGAGFGPGDLLRAGFSATELRSADYAASELRRAGFAISDLKEADFSSRDLKAAGISIVDLKTVGFSAYELRNAGFITNDLRLAGFSASELCADFTPKDLRIAGYSLADLIASGIPASELRRAEYSARDLSNAGYKLEDLTLAGFQSSDLRRADFTAQDLRANGYHLEDLKQAGFSALDMRRADYSAKDLRNAGYSIEDLVMNAGFSEKDMSEFVAHDLEVARYLKRRSDMEGMDRYKELTQAYFAGHWHQA